MLPSIHGVSKHPTNSTVPGGRSKDAGRSGAARLPFWLISLVLHGAGLGLALMFAPVREVVFRRDIADQTEVIMRGEPLAEIVEVMRDRTADALRERVSLLLDGRKRMAVNFTTLNSHYQPVAEAQQAVAGARMGHYAERLREGHRALGVVLASELPPHPVEEPLAEARRLCTRALGEIEDVRRSLYLLTDPGQEQVERMVAAEDSQYALDRALRRIEESHQNILRRKIELPGVLAEREAADTEHQALVEQMSEYEASVAAAREKLQQAREHNDAVRRDAARADERETADKAVKDADTGQKEAQAALNALTRPLRDAAGKANNLKTRVDRIENEIKQWETRLTEAWKQARSLLAEAVERQNAVLDDLLRAVAQPTDDTPQT